MSRRGKKQGAKQEEAAAVDGTPRRHEGDDEALRAFRNGDDAAFETLTKGWLDDVNDHVTRTGMDPDKVDRCMEAIFRTTRTRVIDRPDESFGAAVMAETIAKAGKATHKIDSRLQASARTAGKLSRGTDASTLGDDSTIRTMVRDGASVLGPNVAEVLDLHWRHELDAKEIGVVLSLDEARVVDMINKAPQGLAAAVRTRLLWAGGKPEHLELADELSKANATEFSAETVRVIHRHVRSCTTCRSRSMIALPAIDIFAAMPLDKVEVERRTKLLGALAPAAAAAATVAAVADTEPAAAEPVGKAEPPAPEPKPEPEPEKEPEPVSKGEPPAPEKPDAAPAAIGGAAGAWAAGAADAPKPPDGEDEKKERKDEKEGDADKDAALPALAGFGAAAATSAATSRAAAEPAPVHEPVRSRSETEGKSKRPLILTGAAAAIVIVLLIVVALTRGGGKDNEQVDIASANNAKDPTTTTTRPPTTTSTASTTTTAPTTTAPPTTEGGPAPGPSGGPSPAPAPGPAPAPTPPPLDVDVQFAMSTGRARPRIEQNYPMGAAVLSWNVTSNQPVEVSVTGPGLEAGGPTGSIPVCPGGAAGATCPAGLGFHYYRIIVRVGGKVVDERTASLEIVDKL